MNNCTRKSYGLVLWCEALFLGLIFKKLTERLNNREVRYTSSFIANKLFHLLWSKSLQVDSISIFVKVVDLS